MSEIKEMIQKEFESFKSELGNFVDKEGLTKAFEDFKNDIASKYDASELKTKFTEIEESVKIQGSLLRSMKLQGEEKAKSFKDQLVEMKSTITENIEKGLPTQIFTTRKSVLSSNVTNGTLGYRDGMVGQIQRGTPYLRDLLQVVSVGSNTQGTVRWFEQTAVTNNAATTGEDRTHGSQSNLTWAEKTLSGKRIVDYIKVGVDQIKDVDFVMGEVQQLINKNMRLKENDQLLNGDGLTNNIAGLLTYATAFNSASAPKVINPNLLDLTGLCVTQIENDMLGGAMPNYVIANRKDVDGVRYAKTTDGDYVFPQFVAANMNSLAGVPLVENPLVTADTMVVGDFNLATLYVWDDLVIEMYFEGTDKRDGLITIGAYMRENLRVKDVDKKAFVKVASIATELEAITDTIVQNA